MSNEEAYWLMGGILIWLIGAGAGGYVAVQKGRPPEEGWVFGGLFSIFGVIVVACLPERKKETRSKRLAYYGDHIPEKSLEEEGKQKTLSSPSGTEILRTIEDAEKREFQETTRTTRPEA